MAKNVLIIAFHYPPQSNGGVQRPYAFAKYLKKNGYNAYIITADYFKFVDQEQERNIYRIKTFDDNLKGKKVIKRIGRISILSIKIIRKILYKIGFVFIYNYYWNFNVKRKIGEIISETKPDIVFATFPPINCSLLGLYIKRRYDIPLILDFRDGFLFEGLEKFNFFQKFIAKILEKKIVRNSDEILTVSPPITKYFERHYNIKKIRTIYNGFDTDDLKLIDLTVKGKVFNKFRIIHFGGFGSSSYRRDFYPLIYALDNLKRNGVIEIKNFELSIYGRLADKEMDLIKKYNLGDVIKYYGLIDRKDGLKIMRTDCSALLFYGDLDTKSVVSTKLLEYIFMNKPILGICKGNEAENIINRTKTGIVTDFTVDGIMEGFKKIMNCVDFDPDWDEINRFSREKQTKELIQVIESIC